MPCNIIVDVILNIRYNALNKIGKLSPPLLRMLIDIPSSWFFAVVFFHWVAYSLLSLVYPVSPQWTLVVSAVIWSKYLNS